jgi:signal transduction histidine kinase
MRTLLLELRPTALAEVELGDLLRQLVEAVTGRARLPVTLTIDGKCSLAPDAHVMLYRIAQEALNNVAKHAGASRASVSLWCAPTQPAVQDDEGIRALELRIEDDGRGFDPQDVPAECMGLCIMRERADSIGAAIRIESQPGHGTQLTVKWPALPS